MSKQRPSRGGGIPCPKCRGESSRVERTTQLPGGGGLHRVRRCSDCGRKYVTREILLSTAIDLTTCLKAAGLPAAGLIPPVTVNTGDSHA
jgi:hypothetical protein